jgi:thiol-disulfide isomerase/thioredoxin
MQAVIRTTLVLSFVGFLMILQAQDVVPHVFVKTMEGKNVEFGAAIGKDKLTVVSFWATWCAPCKKELDAMSELYDDWQDKYDMQLVAVSIDDARAAAKVKPMVAEKGWPFMVLVDTNQELMRALHFQSVPYTIIIDHQGQIVYNHSGYLPGDELELEEKLASFSQ